MARSSTQSIDRIKKHQAKKMGIIWHFPGVRISIVCYDLLEKPGGF